MTLYVAPIVEGETEEGCVPTILLRIWDEVLGATTQEYLEVLPPSHANRSSLLIAGNPELPTKIEPAFRRLQKRLHQPGVDRGLILVLSYVVCWRTASPRPPRSPPKRNRPR